MTLLTAPIVLAYCAVTAALSTPLLRVVYGQAYERYSVLVVLWAVLVVLVYSAYVMTSVANAQQATKLTFRANAHGAAVACLVALPLTALLGAEGAILATVLGTAAVLLTLWRTVGPDGFGRPSYAAGR